jgi:hypothetical protein
MLYISNESLTYLFYDDLNNDVSPEYSLQAAGTVLSATIPLALYSQKSYT